MGQKNLNNDFSLEKEVGGKAKNLSLLKKKGLNVPSFFIIPHTNFENFKLKDIVKNLTYKIKPLNKTLILRSSATGGWRREQLCRNF